MRIANKGLKGIAFRAELFALALVFISCASVVHADGILDGRIGEPYGSTRALDSGNDVTGDGECANTAGRGNLMDFFALSVPGGSGTNDAWHFSWTVDSSHPLSDTTGSFFGVAASNRANYLIGIEVNCDGAPRLEMWQNGQPWEREFAWNVDYFIAMYATGTNSMEAQLWRNEGSNNRSLVVGGIVVTSRVIGFRRQLEFALPGAAPVPVELRNNTSLCLYLLSVRDIEGAGTVLDGIGLLNHNVNCEGPAFDLASLGSIFINTEVNAKTGGRPTDPGANDRQSLSYPARGVTSPVSGQSCNVPPGLGIDGQIDSRYVLLTEAAFAAPYAGGSAGSSDFVGESSARTYTLVNAGATNTVTLPGGQHGDIANLYAYADTNYLYLLVTGPTALGWELEPDLFNLFVAIDMPGQSSGISGGTFDDLAPGSATAPANRLVNFKGWDPDYMVELVWRGVTPGVDQPANLYAAASGSWSNTGTFLYRSIENTATNPIGLLYSRTFPQYEFAIPWNRLGRSAPPSGAEPVRLSAYTTGDENLGAASVNQWDIADQAPGIGQGCNGEGCHERVGDDAMDDDAVTSTGLGDRTPYVGRTFGAPGVPPATDNSINDVDTIEEFFAFAIQIENCAPSIILEKFVNGQDADAAPGPFLNVGSSATWTYSVTNSGNVGLTNVVVYDDQVGPITNRTGGDANGNGVLDINEVWTFTATGLAITGHYMNVGSVTARLVFATNTVNDTDPAHYFGAAAGVQVEKYVNGQDADVAPGPILESGSQATWTYVVTNTGNIALTNVVLADDKIGTINGPVSGDLNNNGFLDTTEQWTYVATGMVVAGSYVNTGAVTAVSLTGQSVSDTDPAHHFGAAGGIDIEKSTNGQDADAPMGPFIAVGSNVTWTYVVRNTGNIAITNLSVHDDDLGAITNLVSGDVNGNRVMEPSETWTFAISGIAQAGPYANIGSVTGYAATAGTLLSDSDPSHYFGSAPGIQLEKRVNGQDANTAPGATLVAGSSVTWTYLVSNSGNVALTNVAVTDDRIGSITNYLSGDVNNNRLLDLGEVWTYSATGMVTAGAYVNTGLVQAVSLIGQGVTDIDPAHHFGGTSGIDLEKATNGQDADAAPGPYIPVGSPVTWTYVVRNTGNTVITNVSVYDDDLGPITNLISGDTNGDRQMATNETWTFTAYGIAQAGQYANIGSVTGYVSGVGAQLVDIDPSHYVGSTAGYTMLKTRTNPANRPALVGEPVTFIISIVNTGNLVLAPVVVSDTYESAYLSFTGAVPAPVDFINDGSLLWTNVGPLSPGSSTSIVVQFSAAQFFTGTRTNLAVVSATPPVGHPPLPPQTSAAPYLIDAPARVGDFVWHDLNGNGRQDGGEPGVSNVQVRLYDAGSNVIDTITTSSSGAYQFTNLFPGTYYIGYTPPVGFGFTSPDIGGNDQLDSDPQPGTGFTGPFVLVSGANDATRDAGLIAPASIGDFIWLDGNKNGLQDQGEVGFPDVKITLYDTNDTVIAVTTSAVDGAYAFTNLMPGNYVLRIHVPPTTSLSPQGQGNNRKLDSDFSPFTALSEIITLVSGQHNPDIDAGLNETLVLAQIGSVDGVVSNGVALLRWDTVSEYGTAGWLIERRVDGEWMPASELLPAVGGVLNGARYAWSDSRAEYGVTNTYRIVEIDVHGVPRPSEEYEVQYPKVRRYDASSGTVSFQAEAIPYRVEQVVVPASVAKSFAAGSGATAVKVALRDTGLYRISAADIASILGVNESVVRTNGAVVEHVGRSVPVWRPQGDVAFLGHAYQTMYTEHSIYKIQLGRGDVAKEQAVATPTTAPVTSFNDNLILEQQSVMRPDIFFDATEDIWLWYNMISGVRSQFVTTVSLPHVVSGTGGRIKVRLKGGSQISGNGMHGVRVDWNGLPVATAEFFGLDRHDLSVELAPGAINSGPNTFKVAMTPPVGVTYDHVYVDRIETEYTRSLIAVSNRLVFSASSGPVRVSGFTGSAIEVWDMTDPWQPVRLTGFTPIQDGGSWSVQFHAPRNGRYVASATLLAPVRLTPWLEHDLKDNTHRVDYLVVHGEGLAEGAAALAADRAGKGLRTKVVPIEAVFNAFNHGIVDGRALPAFLGYAYRQWETAPRYVVLAGDGSLDFRNRMGAGDSLVPTPPDASQSGVFASDQGLADINQDGFLEMAVGRLPVVNNTQLLQVLAKIQAFEAGGTWRDRVLISTDNPDVGGHYLNDGNYLASQFTNRPVTRADIGLLGAGGASDLLKSGLAEGQGLSVYIGHGMRTKFAEEGILTTNDVPALDNQGRSGVLLALGCLMGTFGDQGVVNIGEKMVTQSSGAAAMIGSASLVNNRDGNELGNALVNMLYHHGEARLGDAWVEAKNQFVSTASEAGFRTYQLLGDPALAMGSAYAPRGGPDVGPIRSSYDEWRRWAFGPAWSDRGLSSGATDDADADGVLNHDEFVAGTDPVDPSSEFILLNILPLPDGRVALSWPSVPGRFYRIERGDVRTGSFVGRADFIPATAPLNTSYDETEASGATSYRVLVR